MLNFLIFVGKVGLGFCNHHNRHYFFKKGNLKVEIEGMIMGLGRRKRSDYFSEELNKRHSAFLEDTGYLMGFGKRSPEKRHYSNSFLGDTGWYWNTKWNGDFIENFRFHDEPGQKISQSKCISWRYGYASCSFLKKNSTILCERFVDGSWKKKSFER